MTFADIQTEIADRLNLTTVAALARIGRSINERYRWMASELGFSTTQRGTATATTTIGNRSLTFGPTPVKVEKILAVYNPLLTSPAGVLGEVTFDEMRNQTAGSDPARQYAIQLMGADSVTIYLGSTPASAYVLNADVNVNLATLNGVQVPAFAEDYHNLLVYGGMATELDKMEKYDLSQKKEAQFNGRLAELRFYIAKSAYLDIHQGKKRNYPFTPLV